MKENLEFAQHLMTMTVALVIILIAMHGSVR